MTDARGRRRRWRRCHPPIPRCWIAIVIPTGALYNSVSIPVAIGVIFRIIIWIMPPWFKLNAHPQRGDETAPGADMILRKIMLVVMKVLMWIIRSYNVFLWGGCIAAPVAYHHASSLYTHTHTHTCGVFPSWLLFVIVGTACVSIPSDAIGTRHKKIFRLAGGQ